MSWQIEGNISDGYRIMDGKRVVCRVDDEDDARRIVLCIRAAEPMQEET